MKTRIIVKLDVKPPNVVKPVHFEGLRVVDTPSNLAKKYYLQGADEVFYIDIVASLYQRDALYGDITNAAKELFIPMAVGGGIQTIEDCSKLFHAGADKIVINTHAVQRNPEIIDHAARKFGSQSVVVNIEAKKTGNDWECFTDCGRIKSGRRVFDWMTEVEERGAGEILLQSVDEDGRQRGFDLDLAKSAVQLVSIPVVIASGAGSLEDIKDVIEFSQPSGVAIASLLHYNTFNVAEIKQYLRQCGVEVSE